MLLVFMRTYPGTGGWSGSVRSSLSNLDLNDAIDSADLTLFGNTLNTEAPMSENELQRIVFILRFFYVNVFRLHFGPCLGVS